MRPWNDRSSHSQGRSYTGPYVHISFLFGLPKKPISSISAAFATWQTAQMLPCPQNKTSFNSALVAKVREEARCSDRNRNLRPFRGEAELLKPAPNPVSAKVQTTAPVPGQAECTDQLWRMWTLWNTSWTKDRCHLPLTVRRRSGSSGKSWWKNSCLDLLRNNCTPGCLLQTAVFYKATCRSWTFV